jgi:hypothetical protein
MRRLLAAAAIVALAGCGTTTTVVVHATKTPASVGGARDGQPVLNPAPSGTSFYQSGYAFGRAAVITGTPENLNLTPYIAEGNTPGQACNQVAYVNSATLDVRGGGTITANELPPQGNGGPQGQWINGCTTGYGS